MVVSNGVFPDATVILPIDGANCRVTNRSPNPGRKRRWAQ